MVFFFFFFFFFLLFLGLARTVRLLMVTSGGPLTCSAMYTETWYKRVCSASSLEFCVCVCVCWNKHHTHKAAEAELFSVDQSTNQQTPPPNDNDNNTLNTPLLCQSFLISLNSNSLGPPGNHSSSPRRTAPWLSPPQPSPLPFFLCLVWGVCFHNT